MLQEKKTKQHSIDPKRADPMRKHKQERESASNYSMRRHKQVRMHFKIDASTCNHKTNCIAIVIITEFKTDVAK